MHAKCRFLAASFLLCFPENEKKERIRKEVKEKQSWWRREEDCFALSFIRVLAYFEEIAGAHAYVHKQNKGIKKVLEPSLLKHLHVSINVKENGIGPHQILEKMFFPSASTYILIENNASL